MPVALGKAVLTYVDHNAEVSTVKYTGPLLNASNFDATMLLIDDLVTATDNVSTGAQKKDERTATVTYSDPEPPADEYAQRETKWLVLYKDAVLYDRHTVEIPCADLSLLSATSPGVMDITAGAGLAFVQAFEAYVRSPANNAVEVVEIRNVGRNI